MIVHVIDSLAVGGAERALVTLVTGLTKRHERVGVCVTRSALDMQEFLPSDIPLLVLHRSRRWDLGAIFRFGAWCRENGVEILHAHGRSSASFVALARALRATDARIVFHDHFGRVDIEPGSSLALKLIMRFVADAYVCVAPSLSSWATKVVGLAPDRVMLLPNALDLQLWQPTERPLLPSAPPCAKGVLIANLRPEKDHFMLLEAIAASDFLRGSLQITCLGAGVNEGHGRAVQERTRALKLESVVQFPGTSRDVASILDAADFGLIASKSEAGPIASLEYMAMAKPFISTRTGQVVGVAEAASACITVSPANANEMREALTRMVSMTPAERRTMGQNGRRLAVDVFGLDAQLEKLLHLYESLRPRSHRARPAGTGADRVPAYREASSAAE